MRHFLAWFVGLALAALAPACGGAIDRSASRPDGDDAGTDGGLGNGADDRGARTTPPDGAAIAAATSALTGAFRVTEIQIGGYPFGQAPERYREHIVGEMMKVCFAEGHRVTVCECTQPRFAAVTDIQEGGHPTDTCAGTMVCHVGEFSFAGRGQLRLDVPESSLTWPLRPANPQGNDAGEVGARGAEIYVRDLVGLGNAVLEPISGCP